MNIFVYCSSNLYINAKYAVVSGKNENNSISRSTDMPNNREQVIKRRFFRKWMEAMMTAINDMQPAHP